MNKHALIMSEMSPCPVCGMDVAVFHLETHVNSHFDEVEHPRALTCSYGCGQLVPLDELDSHEALHRLQGVPGQQQPLLLSPQKSAQLQPTLLLQPEVIDLAVDDGPQRWPTGTVSMDDEEDLYGYADLPDTAALTARPTTSHCTTGKDDGSADNGYNQPSGSTCVLCSLGCGQWIPVAELDSHELLHRMDSDVACVGVAARWDSGCPWPEVDMLSAADRESFAVQEAADFEALQAKYGFSDKRPGKCHTCGEAGHWSTTCSKNPRAKPHMVARPLSIKAVELVQQQRPDRHPTITGGLIPLLATVLEGCSQPGYTAKLCGPVEHIGAQYADRGWGCGWRNIQMMSSHLLQRGGTLRDTLFGGAAFVPTIASLQAWLEAAWAAGYDEVGRDSLGGTIQGQRKWIGTTEAATLLRYCGVSAHIVDFVAPGVASQSEPLSRPLAPFHAAAHGPSTCALCPQHIAGRGAGPTTAAATASASHRNDGATVHHGVECDLCHAVPIIGMRHHSLKLPNYDVCSACAASPAGQQGGPYQAVGGPAAAAGASTSRQGARTANNEPGQAATSASAKGVADKCTPGNDASAATTEAAAATLHGALLEWVWCYFAGEHGQTRHMCSQPGDASSSGTTTSQSIPRPHGAPVHLTGMPPLYFQHEGHSRTIIGIEQRRALAAPGAEPVYSLLVLDPGSATVAFEQALRQRKQWQKFVRRGLHTLTRPQYQLLYVLDEPLMEEQRSSSYMKVMQAAEVVRPTTL